jgi:hypothetical protein
MYANGLDLNQRLGGESGSYFVGKFNECIINRRLGNWFV